MTERYFQPQKGERPWDSMDIMPLMIVNILFLSFTAMFTYLLLDPNAMPDNPPPKLGFLIGFLTIPLFFVAFQRIMGVSGYSIDENGVVVHHRIGETKIPFDEIEYVKFDSLYAYIPGNAKARGPLTFCTSEEDCYIKRTGNLFGPYFSVRDGQCVLLKLKKDDSSRIALTPESPDEMFELIRGHIPGRHEIDFEDGKRNALQSYLTVERIKEVMARIEDKNIQQIDILPEEVLVKLEYDADYRAVYLEGLESMLTEAKEEIDNDGLMKKMKL